MPGRILRVRMTCYPKRNPSLTLYLPTDDDRVFEPDRLEGEWPLTTGYWNRLVTGMPKWGEEGSGVPGIVIDLTSTKSMQPDTRIFVRASGPLSFHPGNTMVVTELTSSKHRTLTIDEATLI